MADIVSIARASMVADQQRLNTVSHNLANISTDGYKRQVFNTTLQQVETAGESGARSAALDLSQGVLKHTGSAQNIALNGAGFLVAQAQESEFLTRRGTLAVDEHGYLALATGERILGERGAIQLDTTPFEIQRNGDVLQGGRLVDRLKLVNAASPKAIEYVGSGFYQTTQPLEPAPQLQVMQGHLEGSNVESLAEMMELMTTVRHYEAASQVLRSYDQILGSAINDLADF